MVCLLRGILLIQHVTFWRLAVWRRRPASRVLSDAVIATLLENEKFLLAFCEITKMRFAAANGQSYNV